MCFETACIALHCINLSYQKIQIKPKQPKLLHRKYKKGLNIIQWIQDTRAHARKRTQTHTRKPKRMFQGHSSTGVVITVGC